MGYLPIYKHDIFVSYAHVDDKPLLENQNGWVTTLIGCIKNKLSQRLGRDEDYSLWMDFELRRREKLSLQIMDALNSTAIMIIILSPAYLASKWCQQECDFFLQCIRQKNSRVFIVEREEIDRQELQSELQDILGFRFWIADRDGKAPKILGEPIPTGSDIEYFNLVSNLTLELKDALLDIRKEYEDSGNAVVKGQQPTVFLAEVTDDMEQERNNIKSYLNQYGINVLPCTWYSQVPTLFRQAAENDLSKSVAFIQLLSEFAGKKPPDLPKGYVHLQLELAQAAKKTIFQWRSPTLDINLIPDVHYRALVNGDNVRAENFEDFKRAVTDFILQKPKKEKQTNNLTPLVFVNMESVDKHLAEKVCGVMRRRGIDYIRALDKNSGLDPSEIRAVLEKNFLESNGIIIIYGKCPISWVHNQIMEYRKLRIKRDRQLKAYTLFDGPPEQKYPIDFFNFKELHVLHLRKECDETELDNELGVFFNRLDDEDI